MSLQLIGCPDDEGVKNTGGRTGARKGPEAFRKWFQQLNGVIDRQAVVKDLGDVTSGSLQERHQSAADKIATIHAQSATSLLIGGGHDYGYAHLKGLKQHFADATLGCINIDAHFDVRKPEPVMKSGSPFYLILEEEILQPAHLVQFGIQEHCNAPALWDYIQEKQVPVQTYRELLQTNISEAFKKQLQRLSDACDHIVISLDLDGLSSAFAPGVSAPQPAGFSADDALRMTYHAAHEPKVCSLGIYELNPEHDVDDRTARLAAMLAYHFVMEQGR